MAAANIFATLDNPRDRYELLAMKHHILFLPLVTATLPFMTAYVAQGRHEAIYCWTKPPGRGISSLVQIAFRPVGDFYNVKRTTLLRMSFIGNKDVCSTPFHAGDHPGILFCLHFLGKLAKLVFSKFSEEMQAARGSLRPIPEIRDLLSVIKVERNLPARMAILRGELKMQICPICGITREEQDAQQELVSAQFHLLYERWKQRNDPNEPAPGLPVTDEYRVHYALWLYQNDSSKKSNVAAIAREAGVDYNQVAKALNHANRA